MRQVVTPEEMRTIEERAVNSGLSQNELMDRAGRGLASYIETLCLKSRDILIIAGKGNNGGDGYTAGSYLIEKGYKVRALQLPEENPPHYSLCKKIALSKMAVWSLKLTIFYLISIEIRLSSMLSLEQASKVQ